MTCHHFVDSNVLLLAAGGEHDDRESCRRLVHAASDPRFELHAGTEALQEFCVHRLRRSDRNTAIRATRLLNDTLLLHDFDNIPD